MKKIFAVYLLNEKMEFILSSEIKCVKSWIFRLLTITGWGKSAKVIL